MSIGKLRNSCTRIHDANVSIILRPPARFTAKQTPVIEPHAAAMEALMEASASELELAVSSFVELPDSIGVRNPYTDVLPALHSLYCSTIRCTIAHIG